MRIGEPQRIIIVEPLELPVGEPQRLEPEPEPTYTRNLNRRKYPYPNG